MLPRPALVASLIVALVGPWPVLCPDPGVPAARPASAVLALREKLAPDSLAVADSLNELGDVAREQGDMAAAKVCLQRALVLGEKQAPDSLSVATSLHYLGNLAFVQGELAQAKSLYQRAL